MLFLLKATHLLTDPRALAWAKAFLLTQIVEMPIYAVALRDRSLTRRIGLAFAPSLLTHPFVWFAFPALLPGHGAYWTMVALAEVFAVFGEAALLASLAVEHPLAWSVFANGTSFAIGLGLRYGGGLV